MADQQVESYDKSFRSYHILYFIGQAIAKLPKISNVSLSAWVRDFASKEGYFWMCRHAFYEKS